MNTLNYVADRLSKPLAAIDEQAHTIFCRHLTVRLTLFWLVPPERFELPTP